VFDDEDLTRRDEHPLDDHKLADTAQPAGWTPPAKRERPFRQATRLGTTPTPADPPAFRKVPNGTGSRRGPSYPDWEKPPTQYTYPRLGRRQARRTLWIPWPPVIAVLLVIALVVAAFFLVPVLGRLAGMPGSPSPSASVVVTSSPVPSGSPSPSAAPTVSIAPSPSPIATPQPGATYLLYKVQAGDTLSRIATKFGIKTWQLLKANPSLAADPNTLKAGMVINIPVAPTPAPSA
jgi:LysM repeat protein